MRSRASLLPLLPIVVATSIRAWWLFRRLPLDRVCHTLTDVQPLPPPLRDPEGYLYLTNRLLRYLPPRGLRPCFKRSLLLLDLWSRCGYAPRLHLGMRRPADRSGGGHAWVTVEDRPELSLDEAGYAEAFVWDGLQT
jgi:hypothetical protein